MKYFWINKMFDWIMKYFWIIVHYFMLIEQYTNQIYTGAYVLIMPHMMIIIIKKCLVGVVSQKIKNTCLFLKVASVIFFFFFFCNTEKTLM